MNRNNQDIAIIGMACRFPGARNLSEFWTNLLDGRDTITTLKSDELSADVPAELRDDPRYVHAAGLIDQPYAMDAGFFGSIQWRSSRLTRNKEFCWRRAGRRWNMPARRWDSSRSAP